MEERKIGEMTLQEYEVFLKNEERSDATIEKYMRDIRRFFAYGGSQEICKQRVLEYKNKVGRSYAVTSANSMLAALNSFFRFCGWHDLCVKQFRVQRQAYCSEEKELTHKEYVRLLEAARRKKNERLYLILQTICATGIRVSELQYITIDALHKGEAVVNCKGKNRRIFIVPKLKQKLLRYVDKRKISTGAVFITKNKKPINRINVWKEMKALCAQAKVAPSKVFPHNLRHLFARSFYKIEKDIVKLADILGHASVNTTRIYTVTTGAEHKRKMELMHLII